MKDNSGYIFEKPLQLTSSQRDAVNHGDGPLLIVAGAGTGKTLCMAHRVARLISSRTAATNQVLVLTFSSRAAAEMEERIDLLLPYAFSDIWVSTFHSFGRRIIESHSLEAGIPLHFRVLTPQETTVFLRENLFQLPLDRFRPSGNPTGHLRALAGFISRLKDEDISCQQYSEFAASLPGGDPVEDEKKALHRELSAFYQVYQSLMSEAGFLDMADLVYTTLQIFRHHPLLADQYRRQFHHILVDEFQDTNHSQYELLKILSGGRKNLTVVGDDDQSIYKFRGAAISNILSFIGDFPDAVQVVLKDNFRSAKTILDASYRLITHNNPDRLEIINNIDKKLKGREDPDASVSHRIFNTQEDQAAEITELIAGKVGPDCRYRDIAVLVRANRNAEPILSQLNFAGIPFTFSGNTGLYGKPEVRSLISFFRILTDPSDSLSLHHLASSEIFGLDGLSLINLNRLAKSCQLTLEEAFRSLLSDQSKNDKTEKPRLSRTALSIIAGILSHLDNFRNLSPQLTAGRLLYQFLQDTGYLGRLGSRSVDSPETKTRNIALFFQLISRFESVARHPYSLPFISYLDDLIEAGDDPESSADEADSDGVRILTVHKAKGLEFPIVIIASAAEGNFPSRGRAHFPDVPDELIKERLTDSDFHIAEERRLFYVAMTRAKKELYLFGVRDFGGKRLRKVSRFIMEALDRPIDSFKSESTEPAAVIERFAPKPPPLPEPDEGIIRLTYRHIDDYLTCPLKYRYVHIMRIPVRNHHLVVYGKALHSTAMDFLRRRKEGLAPAEDDLMTILNREWSQEGFLSQEHEKIRLDEAKKTIGEFYRAFYHELDPGETIDREYRFNLGNIHISGRWDRLRKTDSGVIITDFRSSDVKDQKTANRKARSSVKNRLSILAFEAVGEIPLLHLESYFMGSGITGILKPSAKMTASFTADIKKTAAGIAGGDFEADPESEKCSRCAYFNICPASAQ